jgi:hypothetical protein
MRATLSKQERVEGLDEVRAVKEPKLVKNASPK